MPRPSRSARVRRVSIGALVGLVGCGEAALSAFSQVSNDTPAPHVITIDGRFDDWAAATAEVRVADDGEDDGRDQHFKAKSIAGFADIVALDAAQSEQEVFFRLHFREDLPTDRIVDFAIYIDTDDNIQTGYQIGSEIGAEFLIVKGLLMPYTGTDGVEWSWGESLLSIKLAPGLSEKRSMELSVTRASLGLQPGQRDWLRVLVAGIDTHSPDQWQDDITDFVPEANGQIGSIPLKLTAAPARPLAGDVDRNLERVRSWGIYYGQWNREIIDRVNQYDLLVLASNNGPSPAEQAPIVQQIRAGKNGIQGDDDDVFVLGYVSLGEDSRTFDNQPEIVEHGAGPAYWDPESERFVLQHQGVASYYLDEKIDSDLKNPGQDGVADRHGTWGACYVNAGDEKWQDFLFGRDGRASVPYSSDLLLHFVGYDGLFLDTPEVADPWHGYGYVAEGMYRVIERLDHLYPNHILLLNRGLFFFMPSYPHQYRWNPTAHVDILLFESHYLDSDYHVGDRDYNLSPFFPLSQANTNPKLQVEFGRRDGFDLIVNVDYAKDPDQLGERHPEILDTAIEWSERKYGRREFITNRWVDATPRVMVDYPMPADVHAPEWDNSTVGFVSVTVPELDFMTFGTESNQSKPPRVGVQKAFPEDGGVTVLWDVANDQSPKVRYNVYVSDTYPIDFDRARVLKDVPFEMSPDYVNRGHGGYDDACPYQYTVPGLDNLRTYYFAVRAEDRSQATEVESGRIGPNGGIEDLNQVTLGATPRPALWLDGIRIDGRFDDWDLHGAQTLSLDAATSASVRTANDIDELMLDITLTGAAWQADTIVYLNIDQKSFTGAITLGGADWRVRGDRLERYQGDGFAHQWADVQAIDRQGDATRVELSLPLPDAELIQLWLEQPSGSGAGGTALRSPPLWYRVTGR